MMTKRHRRIVGTRIATLLLTAALLPIAAAAQTTPAQYIATFREAENVAIETTKTKRNNLRQTKAFFDAMKPKVQQRIDDLIKQGKPNEIVEAAELNKAILEYDAFIISLEAEVETADVAVAAATAKLKAAERLFNAAFATPKKPTVVVVPVGLAQQGPITAPVKRPDCSLIDPFQTKFFDPEDCLEKERPSGTITIGDRPVQRDGFSAQLTSAGSGSAMTLRLGGSQAHRTPMAENGQKLTGLSWNVGASASTAKGSDTAYVVRIAEKSENRSLFESDKLDAGFKLLGGIQFNDYGTYSNVGFKDTVYGVVDAAQRACIASEGKGSEDTVCHLDHLHDWMEKNRSYKRALNDAYWGGAKNQPVGGWGVQVELAFPKFNYIPLDPSLVTTVPDIPTAFKNGDATSETRLDVSILAYVFTKLAERTSFMPSLSYKREWAIPTASKDVDVCTADAPNPIFISNCRTLNIAGPVLGNTYFGGLEMRHYSNGKGIFPALGFAPRYTYEFSRGRHAFDMPVWLALDTTTNKLNAGLRFIAQAGGTTIAGENRKPDWGVAFFLGTSFDFSEPRK